MTDVTPGTTTRVRGLEGLRPAILVHERRFSLRIGLSFAVVLGGVDKSESTDDNGPLLAARCSVFMTRRQQKWAGPGVGCIVIHD